MKIIFMGSPIFAAPALQKLIASQHEIICVYTQAPKPAGRGHKLKQSYIHEIAEKADIEVRYPQSLKPESEQDLFAQLNADVAIVVAYGLLLPKEILESPKYGCINIHPSLLPRWRGAAPIQRSIMAGDTQTAMCIMQMDEGLDTGDILLEKQIHIADNYNAGLLHDEMADLGADMVLITLEKIERGKIIPRKQSSNGVTYASKINKDECIIDWNKTAQEVLNKIRGLSPYPRAYFIYNGEKIKILEAEIYEGNIDIPAGKTIDNSLTIACKTGAISPITVQRSGKKSMNIQDMLRGFSIPKGAMIE